MTKKQLLLLAFVPLTIAVTLGANTVLPPCPAVTKANFDCIKEGMTQAEVKAIFGVEPLKDNMIWSGTLGWHSKSWQNQDGAVARIGFKFDSVDSMAWTESTDNIVVRLGRRLLRIPPPAPAPLLGTSNFRTFRGSTSTIIAR